MSQNLELQVRLRMVGLGAPRFCAERTCRSSVSFDSFPSVSLRLAGGPLARSGNQSNHWSHHTTHHHNTTVDVLDTDDADIDEDEDETSQMRDPGVL